MINLGKNSDYIRISHEDTVIIEAVRIEWNGPHEPLEYWDIYRELPKSSSEEEIDRAVFELLRNKNYFTVCDKCMQRRPVGLMDQNAELGVENFEYICHGCMSKHFQVLF